jgi:hypothetical protein
MPVHAVAGASGHVGRYAVHQLLARGVPLATGSGARLLGHLGTGLRCGAQFLPLVISGRNDRPSGGRNFINQGTRAVTAGKVLVPGLAWTGHPRAWQAPGQR